MKKLDKLLFLSFIPPFILASGIVMFVFTMQSLFKYVDDIIGKGASTGMIIEFVLYLSVGLLPMALPAAVLLASLFLMGGFAERYELNSMKSAGVSFQRIVRPLVYATLLISLFSFFCANNIVPFAFLKYRTLLQNFKNQKLALNITEGIFNDDFRNYSIRVGKNNKETGEIQDVMLYDHSQHRLDKTRIVLAKRGNTDMQSDDRYMIMTLEEGSQYQEMDDKNIGTSRPRRYPYLRTKFKKLDKYLNMEEFEMADVSEKVFKSDSRTMGIQKLFSEKDTLLDKIEKREEKTSTFVNPYLHFVKKSDSTSYYLPMQQLVIPASTKDEMDREKEKEPDPLDIEKEGAKQIIKPIGGRYVEAQLHGKPSQFVDIFSSHYQKTLLSRSDASVSSIEGKLKNTFTKIARYNEQIFHFDYQVHLKFSLAVACLVFLFIGAPLGAIIRKGGFGYPVLIGVVLFVLFVVFIMVSKKLGESGSLPAAWLAAWLPVIIFFIPCLFLTRAALRDAQPISGAAVSSFFKRLAFWKK